MKTIKAEWVPVPEDLEPGRYVIYDPETLSHMTLGKREAYGGWVNINDMPIAPISLLAVNGQIVRVG
jgi:hypothetical protein